MSTTIRWLREAADDLRKLDKPIQQRITDAIGRLRLIDDPSQRLVPYEADLSGLWKLRVGDYRVVCELEGRGPSTVIIVHVVHRSTAYGRRSVATIKHRRDS